MSRWQEQFNLHPFQLVWNDLKNQLLNIDVDDVTVITDVVELARLKKVTSYIDHLVFSIDPELVPLSVWDNFHSQVVIASQYISAFNTDKNIHNIINANACSDNLLTYVRPYMVNSDDVIVANRKGLEALRKEFEGYVVNFKAEADNTKDYINDLKVKFDSAATETLASGGRVQDLERSLIGVDGSEDSVKNIVYKLVEEFNKKYDEINGFYNETLVSSGDRLSTKKIVTDAKKIIIEAKEQIEETVDSVEKEVSELKKFYVKIYGGIDKTGSSHLGIDQELEDKVKALNDFEGMQKRKYEALNIQIESLLPGATSAGLASAYKGMKDSFAGPIRNMSKLFYISIAILVIFSIFTAVKSIGWFYIEYNDLNSWENILKSLINKLPFYAPVLWLALYASKRRSEYQRLQQEYAHKEALASSYESYKKQIYELDAEDKEMQKSFIGKTIDAIAFNASGTLDAKHGDKLPIQEMVNQVISTIEIGKKSS
nr:hypothetical protein [uncultured Deefgea sp.]